MPQAGERVAGKYVLQERLGEGGFGEVWLARHATLGTPVAVKFLRKRPERLLQEAEALLALEHPHIVQVYRVDPERAAIVMEYVDGPNLRDWAAQRRPAREEILTVLDQVAAALDFVHQKGLVHGDVKPTNILVAQEPGGALKAKLADFGLTASPEELRGGTRAYLAPEQIQKILGKAVHVDGRADQYALAAVAYELLANQHPYPTATDDLYALLVQRQDPPRPVYEVNPDVPTLFDEPLRRALAYDPEARFPTCRAFVDALWAAEDADRQNRAQSLRNAIRVALQQKDLAKAEERLKELISTLGGRLEDEDHALAMYLEMLRAWQRAHKALREALAQWPDLRDDKDLLPVLAPERVPWTRRVRQAAPQVLAAFILSLPFALGFFVLALRAIARRGAP